MATQYKTSDFLADRHPYFPEDHEAIFTKDVNPHEVRKAFGRRGCTKLLEVLQYEEATEKEKVQALVILHNTLSNQTAKMEAISNGAAPVCTKLLSDASSAVRGNAALVLARLAVVMMGRKAMAKAGSVDGLVKACLDSDVKVREAGTVALTCLGYFRDGWDILIAKTDKLADLVTGLEKHPGIVSIFINITAHYEEGIDISLDAGLMKPLVAILNSSDNSIILKDALMALRSICTSDKGKLRAVEAGSVAAILKHLRDGVTAVRLNSTGALASISVALEAKTAFSKAGEEAVSDLVECCWDAVEGIATNARAAIQYLATLAELRHAFARQLVTDLPMYKAVMALSACDSLSDLLGEVDSNSELAGAAAFAVCELAESKEGLEKLMGTLHLVPRLCRACATAVSVPKPKHDSAGTAATINGESAPTLPAPSSSDDLKDLIVATLKKMLEAADDIKLVIKNQWQKDEKFRERAEALGPLLTA